MSGRSGKTKRPAPRRAPRALLFIAACFLASAGARVGEVGDAVAQGLSSPTVDRGAPGAPAEASASAGAGASAGGETRPAPLLAALRDQSEALGAREARVAERERLLEITETRLREEIERLEETERRLKETLNVAEGAAERDVAHLVGVYETMKPRAAADIFATMDPSFAAGFLARMKPQSAASIIAELPNESAYAVTAVMAARHADVPTR